MPDGLRPIARAARTFAEWSKLGVKRADGGAFPRSRRRHPVLSRPACRARLSSSRKNFDVIKDYNNSDVYALAIGHLADRMRGMAADQGDVAARTPPSSRATTGSRCRSKLAELGYKVNNFTAHIDFDLRDFDPRRAGEIRHASPTAIRPRPCSSGSG